MKIQSVSLLTVFFTILDFVCSNPVELQFQLQPQSQPEFQSKFQNQFQNNLHNRQFLQSPLMTTEAPKEQESSFFNTALSYAPFIPYWPFITAYNWATNSKTREEEMEEFIANIPGLHPCTTVGLSCERAFECCSGNCAANWMGNKKCYQPSPVQL